MDRVSSRWSRIDSRQLVRCYRIQGIVPGGVDAPSVEMSNISRGLPAAGLPGAPRATGSQTALAGASDAPLDDL